MNKKIALLNVDHYRKMLAIEPNETKRQTLLRLLAEEQAKLAALDHPPNKEVHETCLVGVRPIAPVGRPHVDPLLGFSVDPSAENTTARKRESMRSMVTDHREFEITVKWRC